jgi:hypothetical protein
LGRGAERGVRGILSSGVVLAAIVLLSLLGHLAPSAKPVITPLTQFSADRALDTLHRILGPDAPHPVGSGANDAVRAQIFDELARLGYQPQLQTAFACSELGGCAAVTNVLARLDGTEQGGGAVLLAAHYDSVPSSSGDSDDGTGVAAVLEIARVLKFSSHPRHSVILLIDDGEEAGLLGARAFVDSDPWAREVRAAVNVDARGTSGPSLLFETGSANAWAVRLYAQSVARPAASSIFYDVYKRLPNDTDFTIFKSAGYQGLNFAFIGEEPQYHSRLDNSANVSLPSLQHQGQNALASIVALANSDLSAARPAESVFFDLFGRKTIYWPAHKTLIFAILAAIFLLGQLLWLVFSKRLAWGEFLAGLLAWLVIMVAVAVLAFILRRVMNIVSATPVNWVAHPLPIKLAFALLAIAIVVWLGAWFSRRAEFWGLWGGVWVWWSLLSIIAAAEAPALSYLVVVPTCAAALFGLPATVPRRSFSVVCAIAVIVPLAFAALVGVPPLLLLYDALGNRSLILISLSVGLIFTPFAPLCSDLRSAPGMHNLLVRWVPILATALAAFAAIVVPAYSAKSPERVNIEYAQDADSGQARWIVQPDSGHMPDPLNLAASFHRAADGAFPWDSHASFVSSAPHLDLAAPTFTILDSSQADGRRNYTALLRSERAAPFAAVLFPPDTDVESLRMEGQTVQLQSSVKRRYFRGWALYSCVDMPPTGVHISFSLPIGKPVEVRSIDRSYGLPAEGQFLLNSRPLTATPSQDGDVTIVSRRVQLFP